MAKYGNGNGASRSEVMMHFVAGHAVLVHSLVEGIRKKEEVERRKCLKAAAENLLRTAIMLRKEAGDPLSPQAEEILAKEAEGLAIAFPGSGQGEESGFEHEPDLLAEERVTPLVPPLRRGHRTRSAGKPHN